MLCQNCGENEANIKYTQIINGVKKQMNLCENCARKLGIENMAFKMPSINFSNFLGGMFDDNMADFIPSLIKPKTLLCDKCGSSYEDFIDSGKFGCDECYNTFSNQIDILLKNIHGVNRHIGRGSKNFEIGANSEKQEQADNGKQTRENQKQSKKLTKEQSTNRLEELKERLKQEIKEERYEDAAKTRDEIKKKEGMI